MTITKSDLINSVYENVSLPKNKSAKVIESLLEIIKKTLENGEDIMISRFGKFYVKESTGRKPMNDENYMPGESRQVVFKCSAALMHKINH